ncbi:MAG: DNA polymerase III subunit epsilon [Gammaproteobacteria bacterium GWE2_37_16]|nr:MAG: DNA polymerase III subunit epsilon [Gammaproteobacteria bacterium GWE2_37_16]
MSTRQIVLDTETTGLTPEAGHRIIEIGGIELDSRRFTGNTFHVYINPQRIIEAGALQVHGISNEFLADKPLFSDVIEDFLIFIQGAELIIHNAVFDVGFLNHELKLYKKNAKPIETYASIFDTLALARKKHPGQRNNLDALCKRYNINNKKRDLHGALLDAKLLAEVYLAMTGGQVSLFTNSNSPEKNQTVSIEDKIHQQKHSKLRVILANNEELTAHDLFMKKLKPADIYKKVN